MKKALFSIVLLLQGILSVHAQDIKTSAPSPSTSSSDQEIRKATEALTEKYNLNADQAKQMPTRSKCEGSKIWRKSRLFKDSDPALYLAKVQNVSKRYARQHPAAS
jgi:hypothetical protein